MRDALTEGDLQDRTVVTALFRDHERSKVQEAASAG
jgi:hypothetical protein